MEELSLEEEKKKKSNPPGCDLEKNEKFRNVMNYNKNLKNKQRSNTFGLVLNPLLTEEKIDWSILSEEEMFQKLEELNFPTNDDIREVLNSLEFENVNKNLTMLEDFEGQFELGSTTRIPHYQIALKTKSICSKKPILDALTNLLTAHINIDIQFNYQDMKNYCSKESGDVLSLKNKYTGRIVKHQWNLNFIDRKPELQSVLDSPYPWQKFFLEEILTKKPDSRIVDWLIDPVGNTGKSSFARAYVSQIPTDAILCKIDNLDRMEMSLIEKILKYRDRYHDDPRILFFDFPRAADTKKVLAATALMEDAKSGHLETSFGGKHREAQIGNVHVVVLSNGAPDLSVLSEDRWRLWRFGGTNYQNVIWPCHCAPNIEENNETHRMIRWNISVRNLDLSELSRKSQYQGLNLDDSWLSIAPANNNGLLFLGSRETTKSVVSSYNDAPNEIRLLAMKILKNK